MHSKTFTIGELSREFGVTPRALRFYEDKELLAPIREGQRRLFTPRDRARLKLILRGKRFGFSLDEMRELLDLYDVDRSRVTQLSAAIEAARRHHRDLMAKRDELNQAIADLEAEIGEAERMLAERGRAAVGR